MFSKLVCGSIESARRQSPAGRLVSHFLCLHPEVSLQVFEHVLLLEADEPGIEPVVRQLLRRHEFAHGSVADSEQAGYIVLGDKLAQRFGGLLAGHDSIDLIVRRRPLGFRNGEHRWQSVGE